MRSPMTWAIRLISVLQLTTLVDYVDMYSSGEGSLLIIGSVYIVRFWLEGHGQRRRRAIYPLLRKETGDSIHGEANNRRYIFWRR